MTVPTVSVVMPAYQASATVATAIRSVLRQSWSDFELIVVDDGSTDATAEIVRATMDSRVRLLTQDNSGPAAARNLGIKAAQAELIAFLDADDQWLPERLAVQLRVAGQADLIYSDAFEVLPDGRCRRYHERVAPLPHGNADTLRWLVVNPNPVPLLTVLVHAQPLRAVGGFDPKLFGVEDLDLWIRLAAAGYRFLRVSEPLAEYRVSSSSVSGDRVQMMQQEARAFERLAPRLPAGTRSAARRRARRLRADATVAQRRRGQPARQRWGSVPEVLRGGRLRPSLGQLLYAASPALLAVLRRKNLDEPPQDTRLSAPTSARR